MTTPQDPYGQPSNPQGFPPEGNPQQPGQYPPPQGQPQYQAPQYPGTPDPQGVYPPAQPGMPGMAGEPPKKKNLARNIIAVVVVVAVALGIVLYFVNRQSDPATAKAGDCIKVNKASATDADVDKIDCTEPGAIYKVTAAGKTVTCDPEEQSYEETTKSHKVETRLCLQPNVATGDCIIPDDDSDAGKFTRVDCAESTGNEDVIKVILFDHTTSDESACPENSFVAGVYETHTGVLCIGPNE